MKRYTLSEGPRTPLPPTHPFRVAWTEKFRGSEWVQTPSTYLDFLTQKVLTYKINFRHNSDKKKLNSSIRDILLSEGVGHMF